MCFSASASLIAGAALSTVGIVTIKKAKQRSDVPFAMIPLLFGIQQLFEGVVWLSFRYDARSLNEVTTYLYSFFAFAFWPIYVPFAVGRMEKIVWRKWVVNLTQVLGVVVGVYLLSSHTLTPVVSQIENKSIAYNNSHFFGVWVITLYFVATVGSCLVSSKRVVNVFGIAMFVLALAAYWIWSENFVSVWCFFAAILSLTIYIDIAAVEVAARIGSKRGFGHAA